MRPSVHILVTSKHKLDSLETLLAAALACSEWAVFEEERQICGEAWHLDSDNDTLVREVGRKERRASRRRRRQIGGNQMCVKW